MLKVQKFLMNEIESGLSAKDALFELKYELGISYSLYEEEKCVILSYSQTESPKENEIVRECRGLILSSDFSRILCKPFTRFYNYGEFAESARGFEFKHAAVSEKVDGTLVSFYFHPYLGKWCCSTRNRAFAEGEVSGWSLKFSDLVFRAMGKRPTDSELKTFFSGYERYTFSFELVSPMNKVVKRYAECSLYFLCMHSNMTGEYVKDCKDVFMKLTERDQLFSKVKYPKAYDLSDYESIKTFMGTLGETDEGFVCYDAEHDIRVKVKNPKYIEIASKRINGMASKCQALHVMMDNEQDEYLAYFPEDKQMFDEIADCLSRLKDTVMKQYKKVESIADRKEFAVEALNCRLSWFLFKLKDGCSFEEILKMQGCRKLAKLI